MALKFYLGQKNSQHLINCNTNSTITEIAGTFDLGTIELEWNECKHAIFPNTPFYIEDTEGQEIWSFIINEDNVEIAKKNNNIKYIHKLTISQSSHKLNNVPLRNTVFTQPFNSIRTAEKGTMFFIKCSQTNDGNTIDSEWAYFMDNTDEHCKEFSFDCSSIKHLKSGFFKAESVLNCFKDSSFEGIIGNETYHINYRTLKSLNNYIGEYAFYIVNYNDPTDYKLIIEDFSTETINLDDEILEWMVGKKLYIKLRYLELINENELLSYIHDPFKNYSQIPMIVGLFKISLNLNGYYYSLWDVLDILNKQCIKKYNASQLTNYYEMPDKTIGQGLELDSIIAPEFNFTQMDLYEAVAKVLSFIDAFPILTEDGVLGYQYLNDLSEDTINVLQTSDIKITLNETNFTNKLASYYQNAKKNDPISFPAVNFYRYATSNEYGIPSQNSWYFFVNKPIDHIEKLDIRTTVTGYSYYFGTFWHSINLDVTAIYIDDLNLSFDNDNYVHTDIAKLVYEASIYNNLETGYANRTKPNKYNSLYFSKGDNKIYCGITGNITYLSGDVLKYVIKRSLLWEMGLYSPGEVVAS